MKRKTDESNHTKEQTDQNKHRQIYVSKLQDTEYKV